MDILFLCVVVFLFLLAVFDLSVGVSNDAVNFLNSAIGSKAASFRRILIVAAIGVFIGGGDEQRDDGYSEAWYFQTRTFFVL